MGTAEMRTVLRIDRIRCDGYGMCAELLPERIELDDWGYPILRPGPVPERLLPLARRAVEVCPVLALTLADVTERGSGGRPDLTDPRPLGRRDVERPAIRLTHDRRA